MKSHRQKAWASGAPRVGMGAVLVTLLWANPVVGQVGAFGATPAGIDASGQQGLVRAPVLTEGAVFGSTGQWTGTVQLGVTTGSFGATPSSVDYEVAQVAVAGSYAPSERLLLAAAVLPWNRVSLSAGGESVSESGRGDASLQARYRAWSSEDRSTDVAAWGAVGLPLGAEGFGSEGVTLGVGGAASRQRDGGSLHASAGILLPFDDQDGESVLRLTGAAVFGVGERTAVSGELQARFSDGEHIVDLAPGIRFQPAPGIFVDAALLVNLATSFESVYDAGLVVALRFGGD